MAKQIAGLREWMSLEITKQMLSLKEEMRAEMKKQEAVLRDIIKQEVRAELLRHSAAQNPESPQYPLVSTEQSRELVQKRIEGAVFSQVVEFINTEVVPHMNKAMEWMNYKTSDGGEDVDSYRRAVEEHHRGDEKKLITDEKTLYIGEHVRLFWNDADEE